MNKDMLNGARNYALADRSDPFAYSRAMSHLKSGIAGYRFDEITGERSNAYYDASPRIETRKASDVEYHATTYDNVKRP